MNVRSRLGISEAATLALALIVTMALAGIAIVFYNSYAQNASNAVRAERHRRWRG